MDRLRAMQAFIAVVQNKSFAVAAARLSIAPSLVSKHIAAIERHLGVRLLNRTTRRVEITEIGQRYYESCVKVLADLEAGEDRARDMQRNPSGSITVRAPHSIAVLYMGQMVSAFSARYPDVEVMLIIDEYPAQSVASLQRGLDLALQLGPAFSSSLASRELAPIQWHPYASRRYLRRHGAPRTLAEVARRNCLIHLAMAPDRMWHFTGPEGEVSIQVSGSLTSNSTLVLRDATLEGMGIAMLPTFCAVPEQDSGGLVRLLPAYSGPQRNLSVLYTMDRRLPSRVRLFLDFMAEWCRTPPWEARKPR